MSHSRPPADLPSVTVFVDPQCPFAWITYQWLRQAERGQAVEVTVELMSLACVNEHQDLDPDYRAYNDDSWAAARVSAALLASAEAHRWPDFYDAYGRRRHVEGLRDNPANIAASLRELGLPADLGNAARDPSWDADLRARTQEAVAGVDPPRRYADHAHRNPGLLRPGPDRNPRRRGLGARMDGPRDPRDDPGDGVVLDPA